MRHRTVRVGGSAQIFGPRLGALAWRGDTVAARKAFRLRTQSNARLLTHDTQPSFQRTACGGG